MTKDYDLCYEHAILSCMQKNHRINIKRKMVNFKLGEEMRSAMRNKNLPSLFFTLKTIYFDIADPTRSSTQDACHT